MKKKERKYILMTFGIMFMLLGVSIACSVADDAGEIPTVISDKSLEEFKINYAGTYTPNISATLFIHGLSMTFNENIRIITSTAATGNFYLDISFNGNQGGSQIQRLMFEEGDVNGGYIQTVIPSTSTDIILKNLYMYTVNGTIDGGDTASLSINLNGGHLLLNSTIIGTKNP